MPEESTKELLVSVVSSFDIEITFNFGFHSKTIIICHCFLRDGLWFRGWDLEVLLVIEWKCLGVCGESLWRTLLWLAVAVVKSFCLTQLSCCFPVMRNSLAGFGGELVRCLCFWEFLWGEDERDGFGECCRERGDEGGVKEVIGGGVVVVGEGGCCSSLIMCLVKKKEKEEKWNY